MSRICPLQLEQGAQTYLGCSMVHRLALEGLENLTELACRPVRWWRQSPKLWPLMMAKPEPPPQQ